MLRMAIITILKSFTLWGVLCHILREVMLMRGAGGLGRIRSIPVRTLAYFVSEIRLV